MLRFATLIVLQGRDPTHYNPVLNSESWGTNMSLAGQMYQEL